MSIIECNKLHQQIIKKINSWPPETVNSNLISNISNNFSYISNNLSYNLSNISANFSSSNSIKSNSTSNSNNDQIKQTNLTPQNGKLSTSNSLSTINSKLSNSLSILTNGKSSNGDSNKLSPTQETNGIFNKNPKSNTPFSSPVHSQQVTSLSNSSIVQVNNAKLDEDLIDVICKLNQKCEFLNKYGERHDYTGKKVNGYFSMLRIIYSFFEYVFNQKKRKLFPELIEVGKLLLHVLNAMEEYSSKYAELCLRYEKGDYKIDYEDEDELSKRKNGFRKEGVEQSISDESSSEDELDEMNNFDNISSNLVKMSSNLANSIESMKSMNAFEDLANNNETFDLNMDEDDDENKEKIEDYYRNNELKDEDDKEYGKEIKKEEYESTLQKYYKRFNFNFKLNKSSSCTSPEDGSPTKKLISSLGISSNNQRPDSPKKSKTEKKYYKYFSNFKNNFEGNFNKFTNNTNTNSETSSLKTISDTTTTFDSPKNGKLPNSASFNALKKEANQDGTFLEDIFEQEILNQESEEEIRLRNAKLDDYTLSKFHVTNDELHLVSPPMLYFYEGFTLTLDRERELSLIYGRIGPFWYCKSAANIVSLVRNLIVILTSPPSKSIQSLLNTDTCARIFAHRQVNATLDSLLQGLATLEVKAYNRRYFKYLYREHVIYGKTIKLPVHSEFQLPVQGNELIRHKDEEKTNVKIELKTESSKDQNENSPTNMSIEENNDEKVMLDGGFNSRYVFIWRNCSSIAEVRCRLINYVRNQNEPEICENSHKCLLFHVHGGGFVLSSPDSHELYLRDWAVKIRGIPILSVDYTLRQKYPKAPQDVLDVYMFLVDPNNKQIISEMIGFQPDKIVVAGDSAGANLAFSLICCLNEIRRNYPEDYANIKMPSSIICVYGAFDIRAVMSPSKFISSIDPILHHGNIMAMIGTYAGIAQKIRKTIWSRIKYRRSIAWYKVSERELKARLKSLSKAMESFFASPLTYPRLDDLKDISLHLISTHFCPLIDDSVVLYKAWKGNSTFDIFDGLPHAFLNFCDRSEEAKIATDKVAERIIQAFKRNSNDQKKPETKI